MNTLAGTMFLAMAIMFGGIYLITLILDEWLK